MHVALEEVLPKGVLNEALCDSLDRISTVFVCYHHDMPVGTLRLIDFSKQTDLIEHFDVDIPNHISIQNTLAYDGLITNNTRQNSSAWDIVCMGLALKGISYSKTQGYQHLLAFGENRCYTCYEKLALALGESPKTIEKPFVEQKEFFDEGYASHASLRTFGIELAKLSFIRIWWHLISRFINPLKPQLRLHPLQSGLKLVN